MNTSYRIALLIVTSALFVGSTGCATATHGTLLDEKQVNLIQKGRSTRADVEALVGRCPNPTMASPDGSRMLTYTFSEAQANAQIWRATIPFGLGGNGSDVTRHNQILTVWIAADGIVKDYEFSDITTDTHDDVSLFGGGHSNTTVRPAVSQAK